MIFIHLAVSQLFLIHLYLHLHFINFCKSVTNSSITSSFPWRMLSATQVLTWLASSTLLKLLSADVTAETCINTSVQYASFSSIFSMPRTCPSIRFSRFIRSFFSFSCRSLCFPEQQGQFFSSLFSSISQIPPTGI